MSALAQMSIGDGAYALLLMHNHRGDQLDLVELKRFLDAAQSLEVPWAVYSACVHERARLSGLIENRADFIASLCAPWFEAAQ